MLLRGKATHFLGRNGSIGRHRWLGVFLKSHKVRVEARREDHLNFFTGPVFLKQCLLGPMCFHKCCSQKAKRDMVSICSLSFPECTPTFAGLYATLLGIMGMFLSTKSSTLPSRICPLDTSETPPSVKSTEFKGADCDSPVFTVGSVSCPPCVSAPW